MTQYCWYHTPTSMWRHLKLKIFKYWLMLSFFLPLKYCSNWRSQFSWVSGGETAIASNKLEVAEVGDVPISEPVEAACWIPCKYWLFVNIIHFRFFLPLHFTLLPCYLYFLQHPFESLSNAPTAEDLKKDPFWSLCDDERPKQSLFSLLKVKKISAETCWFSLWNSTIF